LYQIFLFVPVIVLIGRREEEGVVDRQERRRKEMRKRVSL
jgi:hypothetical protein